MGRARSSREHVLDHLAQLRRSPLRGGPSDAFRARLRAELVSGRPQADPSPPAPPPAAAPPPPAAPSAAPRRLVP
ncbi:hypothetical protein [Nonomuraea indica]|uniref:Uncharacterized protein n=1 Tax=Nonomuraea indica TaxID=1581193 RepID=A0ABW7ZVA4_9ACTN